VNRLRRRLLGGALAAVGLQVAACVAPVPSARANGRFVVVFLRGAYDPLSVLVPYADPFYYQARPNIAIAPPDAADPIACLRLDGRWGLHPVLKESIYPLWQAKQVSFVPFAGSRFETRSHFQAQDWVELGQPVTGRIDYTSGFLNRLVAELRRGGAGGGISFTSQLPLAFKGAVPVANAAMKGPRTAMHEARFEDLVARMYRGHPLAAAVDEGLATRRNIAAQFASEMEEASRGAPPAQGLAMEAARMAKVMRSREDYRVGFIDVGGWDTHVAQGAAAGQLGNKLQALGEGLAALADSLGDAWRNTVVTVISEFGRTFRENGARGTDHGHGSLVWLLGGESPGAGIQGEQAPLAPASLHEGRDLPVLNDLRGVLGAQMARVFGLGPQAIGRVFPEGIPTRS
jgi:uncharacterized protein (DUF1501 family)